jgi:hypothetical protein
MCEDAQYRQFKVSLNPQVVHAFKDSCAKSGVSMASVISQLMSDFTNIPMKRKNCEWDYSTKRRRRVAIAKMLTQLEQIRNAEQDYCDRIPENLCESVVYEKSEEWITILDEIIDLMASL